MPRGILLHGQPGTGKTYFAKMLAAMTDSYFFYASASEFDEIFVGRGPQRIRALFEQANDCLRPPLSTRLWSRVTGEPLQQERTVIIFIDELDAIGKRNSRNNTHATVAQLLTCMDGLVSNPRLFVIAATNKLTNIDPALLRSGRFDRLIQMPLPNKKSRMDILNFYLKDNAAFKGFPEGILDQFAEISQGFSCADLKNFVNEACLRATREVISLMEKTGQRNLLTLKTFSYTIKIENFVDAHKTIYNKILNENRSQSNQQLLYNSHRIQIIYLELTKQELPVESVD